MFKDSIISYLKQNIQKIKYSVSQLALCCWNWNSNSVNYADFRKNNSFNSKELRLLNMGVF